MAKKRRPAPPATPCDGCGRVGLELETLHGLSYCPDCRDARKGDAPVYIRGRALMLSEVERLAKDGDADMAAFLKGDSGDAARKAAGRKR